LDSSGLCLWRRGPLLSGDYHGRQAHKDEPWNRNPVHGISSENRVHSGAARTKESHIFGWGAKH